MVTLPLLGAGVHRSVAVQAPMLFIPRPKDAVRDTLAGCQLSEMVSQGGCMLSGYIFFS